MCGCRHFCIFEIFCETPPTIQEDLANGRPKTYCYPSFYFCFGFLGFVSHQFLSAASPLRSSAGLGDVLEDVLDESCGGDVEDEAVPEFDDSPGTTRGTKFSVLHSFFFPCLVNRGCLPLDHSLAHPRFFAQFSKR